MLRRTVLAALALLVAGACTTFAFPRPTGSTEDAALPPGFLDLPHAGALCSLLFQCPGLAEAIEGSLVVPVDTPSSVLDFSGCMDWLAGPVDPGRPGLASQKKILASLAAATTCDQAYASAPVHPVEGGTCTASACSGSTLEECAGGMLFTTPCGPPVFGATGTCVDLAGTVDCVTVLGLGVTCSPGVSCSDAGELVDCYVGGKSFTSYDCSLSGRTCASAVSGVAACAAPDSLAAPCPGKSPDDFCSGSNDAGVPVDVEHCVTNSIQTQFACAPLGETCSAASGVARCVRPGAACGALDPREDLCVDGGVSVCVGGVPSVFDCASLAGPDGGHLTCIPAAGTQSGHCG